MDRGVDSPCVSIRLYVAEALFWNGTSIALLVKLCFSCAALVDKVHLFTSWEIQSLMTSNTDILTS